MFIFIRNSNLKVNESLFFVALFYFIIVLEITKNFSLIIFGHENVTFFVKK